MPVTVCLATMAMNDNEELTEKQSTMKWKSGESWSAGKMSRPHDRLHPLHQRLGVGAGRVEGDQKGWLGIAEYGSRGLPIQGEALGGRGSEG